jgi:hypothetical protein
MTQRYLEFAAATALACVAATVLAAQTPPARPEDGREVTAVGCLKQERDIHGRMTTAAGEATKPGEGFVLMNARITSASMPEAPTTVNPATTGAGSAGAAAREQERQAAPSGSPGASGAGTSGTGSTSMQSTDRPANEAARGGATAANPAPVRGTDTMYKVVGLPESQMTPLLGQQVEVRATLDANSIGTAALRQPGTTMGSEPASTPNASTPPAPTQAPPTEVDRRDARPTSLPELKAMSIRAAGGRCQGT